MKILTSKHITHFLASVIFLLIPTTLLTWFLLWNGNQYITLLREQWFAPGIYVSSGLFAGLLLAQFRLRFLPLFALLAVSLYGIYTLIDSNAMGEFDSFFLSVQFMVFAILFSAGYIIGWYLQRFRYFPLILSGLFAFAGIYLLAKTGEFSSPQLLMTYLAPVIAFSMYIMYANEVLRNCNWLYRNTWWQLIKRLVGFCLILFILMMAVLYLMYPEINERIEEYGGGGKEGENQMLDTKKDGTVENKQSMGMGASNNRNKNPDPLFCAHIDLTIPGTDIPNPLYLTTWHFTKFDTLTETFERDTTLSFNDEFLVNPAQIPLFSTRTDSTAIVHARGKKLRKTIDIEIYKKRLSPAAFLAPSTAWWIQPITVEKEFQGEFSSAYRAKSYISELNSAYFIYNSNNPQIVAFQQQRFDELRKAKSYNEVDTAFMRYYTHFPSAYRYQKIKVLADSIATQKTATIDKVLAVREYFLQRDALGEKVYRYADNPGVPGLPSASKLMHFLFESKQGYCAYYAGATVFLLRAMGIPSRIVTGFLTVDRSDKNPGWYWFYEDQSHGWVQVYFPEYGWIDFDTTVGNDEAQQSPAPDGTPPMQPPKPVLAAGGKLIAVDTLSKHIVLQLSHLIFKDTEFTRPDTTLQIDVSHAKIWQDSIPLTLQQLKKGSQVMAVSYADKLKSYSVEKTAKSLLKKLPKPTPADELYVSIPTIEEKKNKTLEKQSPYPVIWYVKTIAMIILGLILIVLTLPSMVYAYYKLRARYTSSIPQKAYFSFQGASFLLHQLGIERKQFSYLQFATSIVDPSYGTKFSAFMQIYLKIKYGAQLPTAEETGLILTFLPEFETAIQKHIPIKKRLIHFLNLNTFIRYFTPSTSVTSI